MSSATRPTDSQLPLTFEEITKEIVRLTGLSQSEVEHRVWMEALQLGWNVARDVERLGATPHRYDAQMERLYREGDGFVFETLVFWASPGRQRWIATGTERIRRYHEAHNAPCDTTKILLLGDGAGSDSLYLASHGYNLDYFDFPGSRTFDFAARRFACYPDLKERIRVVPDYASCQSAQYDVVISFEVLEHLPRPLDAISDISRMLKVGGIALVTESFALIEDRFPTHLSNNLRYAGRVPFLFLKHDLALSWYSRDPLFRPSEYEKLARRPFGAWPYLVRDSHVRKGWILGRASSLKRALFHGDAVR